jgi:hypothetical protein
MRLGLSCALILTAAVPAVEASAQSAQLAFQRDRNVSVRQRPRPDFDALGVRAGLFLLYPKVDLSVATEDNIFYQTTNKQSDTISSIGPSITAQSQWSRHSLSAQAQANLYRYSNFSSENNTTYAAGLNGRLDVVRGTVLRGAVSLDHLVEPRYSPSIAASVEPIEYDQSRFSVGAAREFNRVRVSGDVRYRKVNFQNSKDATGASISYSYRNAEFWEDEVRGEYAVSPALSVFSTVVYNKRVYDRAPLLGDVGRDASGWEAAVGTDFDLSRVARGQVQVGYLSQKYDDPRVNDTTGLGVRGKVEWFPTQLITVTVNAERAVDDTGLIGAAGILATRGGAQVDYELLRNLILTGTVNVSKEDFRGVDRTDERLQVTLGGNSLISRRVGVNASYRYIDQSSSGALQGNDFTDNRLQIGVVLQY